MRRSGLQPGRGYTWGLLLALVASAVCLLALALFNHEHAAFKFSGFIASVGFGSCEVGAVELEARCGWKLACGRARVAAVVGAMPLGQRQLRAAVCRERESSCRSVRLAHAVPVFRHRRALPGVLSGANLSFRVRPTVGTAGCATGAQKLQKLRVPGAGLTRVKSVPRTCDRLATSPRVSGPRAERRRANEQGHTTVRPECQPAAASSQKARRTPAPSLAAHDHYPMRRCTPAARTERNGLARPHALDLYGPGQVLP